MGIELSIITISYDDPQGLTRTIESLRPLLQSALRWEHIVVDQSPDKNNICFSKLPTDWPLVRIQENPLGIYGAHNRGLSEAKGELLWFLNGGDALSSRENLESAIIAMKKAPRETAALISPVQVSVGGKPRYIRGLTPDLWANIRGENRICHQAMLIRRDCFTELGPYDTKFRVAADYEHLYRLLVADKSILWSDKNFADFDMGGASSNIDRAFAEFRAVQKLYSAKLTARQNLENHLYSCSSQGFTHLAKLIGKSGLRPLFEPLWKNWKSRG